MVRVPKKGVLLAAVVLTAFTTGCGAEEVTVVEPQITIVIETENMEESTDVEVDSDEKRWSDADVWAMALTLAGECYEDKETDKRLVCEVILNRVSSEDFGDTILDVLTEGSQFNGYWKQSRPVSDNDLEIAEQALKDWYANGCQPLSEFLYFSAGSNRENEFRVNF